MSRSGGQKRPRGAPAAPKRKDAPTNGVIPAFLTKTYDILSTESFRDMISWNEAGDAIVVKRVEEFSENVLPRYFKHSNFASFIRQLNMYDFHKARHENPEIKEFRHPMFLRDRRDLLGYIKRKTAGGPPRAPTYTRARDSKKTKSRRRRAAVAGGYLRPDDDDDDDDDEAESAVVGASTGSSGGGMGTGGSAEDDDGDGVFGPARTRASGNSGRPTSRVVVEPSASLARPASYPAGHAPEYHTAATGVVAAGGGDDGVPAETAMSDAGYRGGDLPSVAVAHPGTAPSAGEGGSALAELQAPVAPSRAVIARSHRDSTNWAAAVSAMRRQQAGLEERMRRMEEHSAAVARQNEMLWAEVLQGRRRQEQLQAKVQKILYFMYGLYTSALNNGSLDPSAAGELASRTPFEILDGASASKSGSAVPTPWEAEGDAGVWGGDASRRETVPPHTAAVSGGASGPLAGEARTRDSLATAARAVEAVAQQAVADVRADRVSHASGMAVAHQATPALAARGDAATTAGLVHGSTSQPAAAQSTGLPTDTPLSWAEPRFAQAARPGHQVPPTTAPRHAAGSMLSDVQTSRAVQEIGDLLRSGDFAITPASPLFGAATAAGLVSGSAPMSPHTLPGSQLALMPRAHHQPWSHAEAGSAIASAGAVSQGVSAPVPTAVGATAVAAPVARASSALDDAAPDALPAAPATPRLGASAVGPVGGVFEGTPLLTPNEFGGVAFDPSELSDVRNGSESLSRHQASALQHLNAIESDLRIEDDDLEAEPFGATTSASLDSGAALGGFDAASRGISGASPMLTSTPL